MKIQKIINQCRRDFTAIYECEHCGHTYTGNGYDDSYFHNEVIPQIKCEKCGKKVTKDYVPENTKYLDGIQI